MKVEGGGGGIEGGVVMEREGLYRPTKNKLPGPILKYFKIWAKFFEKG